jgi:hypothetical protein
MALKKSIETNFGFTVENSYIRVEGMRILEKNKLQFQVRYSVDKTHPHFQDFEYSCMYEIDGQNPFKQAYEHLKALPEFAGATNC